MLASPVPENISKPKILDAYVKELLLGTNCTRTIQNEQIFKSIQDIVHDASSFKTMVHDRE